jgi:hypothetical protein
MTKGLDPQQLLANYQQMKDEQLIRIAAKDAKGLTPEAIDIIKSEIRRRGLPENLVNAIDAQNKSYSLQEIDSYCDLLSGLSCPSCGSAGERLNATMTGEVMSFVLMTHYSKKLKVACPSCLDSANNKALTTTAILGWWGIPWGIIRTIQYISLNVKNKRSNHEPTHNNFLRGFVVGNIGLIETYRNDRQKLREILVRHNAS